MPKAMVLSNKITFFMKTKVSFLMLVAACGLASFSSKGETTVVVTDVVKDSAPKSELAVSQLATTFITNCYVYTCDAN